MMKAESLEEKLNRTYVVGVSFGLHEAGNMLLLESFEYFSKNRDNEAILLRNLGNSLLKLADERHPGVPGKKEKPQR